MTKRRAESDVFCDAPCKRMISFYGKINTQLPGVDVAFGVTCPPTLGCRKRPYHSEEQGPQETLQPRKKSSVNAGRCTAEMHVSENGSMKCSGSFLGKSKAAPGLASLATNGESTKRRMEVEESPHKVSKCEETLTEDDLSNFNSFQFWRVPLPSLDFSMLQSDSKTASLEPDAMET